MVSVLESKRESIVAACIRHGVRRLEVFGSAARGELVPGKSDLDLLVEFDPMAPYDRVEAYFDMLEELRSLLDAKVDLVMVDAVKNPYIVADIERTKQTLYTA
ncbi:MAG TPA: nucleotidyltransferase domain-containing protein [Thermoanaerobaculia bacterium]|nr:nucleotidyltransferase domain-containing protein [Thermoanaerobaculia bacterium]